MVSSAFREMEEYAGKAMLLQEELAQEIAHKLTQDADVIARAIYLTTVSTGKRPVEVALAVNEFLVHLHDIQKEKNHEQSTT